MKELHRPYIYELDPLRAVTALSVVGVHVVALTVALNSSSLGTLVQNALVIALHFTREMFMFVTAFALVYVYYSKPLDHKRYWSKRCIGVLLPYCIWSIIYILVKYPQQSPGAFIQMALFDIITGNASFQLYYILLTLQFYLLFPLFLLFLKRFSRHPWTVLASSLAIQLAVFYADYHLLQKGPRITTGFWGFVEQYRDRFVLTYQFYFLLGGFTALYFRQVRSFLLRHGWLVAGGFLATIAITWLHYVIQIRVYQDSMDYATSVLQPMMIFYSIAVIFFFFWLASCWAVGKRPDAHPRGYSFWHLLSNASFGVYLIHAFFLTVVLNKAVPAMPTTWPVAVRVFLAWCLTALPSVAVTLALLKIPVLSRLVGREHATKRRKGQQPTHVARQEDLPQSVKEGAT